MRTDDSKDISFVFISFATCHKNTSQPTQSISQVHLSLFKLLLRQKNILATTKVTSDRKTASAPTLTRTIDQSNGNNRHEIPIKNYWHANSKYFCAIWQVSAGKLFSWFLAFRVHFFPSFFPPDLNLFFSSSNLKVLLSSRNLENRKAIGSEKEKKKIEIFFNRALVIAKPRRKMWFSQARLCLISALNTTTTDECIKISKEKIWKYN